MRPSYPFGLGSATAGHLDRVTGLTHNRSGTGQVLHPSKEGPMEPVKLLERVAGTAARTVRHPIASAAYAAGFARGIAGAAVHGVTVTGHDPEAGQVPAQPTAGTGVPEPQRVPPPMPEPWARHDQIVVEPEPAGESFATEPKAVSRDSEHGGHASDAEIDAWIDDAMARGSDVDVETPVGTTGAGVGHNPDTAEADLQQPGTEPLFDAGAVKAIRSESEMLQKGAERDPE
jgi:hypothetical protein